MVQTKDMQGMEMLSTVFYVNLGKVIQEMKILTLYSAAMKTLLYFSVSKCLHILWNPRSKPEILGFPKYSGVREHVSPRSVTSAPVTKICLTG